MSHTVVAIDDDVDALEALTIALKMKGYEAHSACTGVEGIELARRYQPSAILVDVMMPLMDGYEVCRTIRADPVIGRTPIIILSARGRLADQAAGLEAGATAYLVKPISISRLVALVDDLVARPAPVVP
jgi:DNA-binding response OmpR family regulator